MDKSDKKQIWKDVLESIQISVSAATFKTYFALTHLHEINEKQGRAVVQVGCNSVFIKNIVETRYFGLIQDTLSRVLEKPTDITFIVKQIATEIKGSEIDTPLFNISTTNKELLDIAIKRSNLRLGFTFENFAVSGSNQMAYAAAEAVAKNPGSAYNPLFIWGGVGVGKTHLMHSVGHNMISKDYNSKILACTAEDFTNDIIEGIRSKSTSNVRKKYRKLDALLIDDIQFIAGKDTAQEEFFHTFNAVSSAGGQIILTSDKPPSEISKLEERLRSRFEAGLIVDIANPDFELRCAIVQIKAEERNLKLDSDIVQLIAGNIVSAREIQGFLVKLFSEVNFKGLEITPDLIQSLVGKTQNIQNENKIKASPFELVGAVSKYYSLGKRDLLGGRRIRSIVRPRQVLMYLLKTQLGLPYQEVGRIVGGRDHTTVMHAVEKITFLASTNVDIREDIRGINKTL